ncbi:UPF0738 family protein [Bacillus xiapuensis]|uniref:UPF0738 family protein n=1 Tax=Bacillus xiapuensis TaxID=2014075 RepID=UPI0012FE1A5A|nr:hypothetical protein [Bacillus xiapuensis]
MRKTIHFKRTSWSGNELQLHAEEPVSLANVTASGQMIVDSDNLAFVYLAEEQDDYIYLYIHEDTWGDLRKAWKDGADLVAAGRDAHLALTNWKEELSYLVSNIEGNSNYGEAMVATVENVFVHE